MTAEGRFLIRTWRDATKRLERVRLGENIPLADHLPPIHERGKDYGDAFRLAQQKRRAHERAAFEALAA